MSDHHLSPRTFVGLDGSARTRMVQHFDAGGQHWTVYEDEEHACMGRGRTLVFETTGLARRVGEYPENWRELPDEQLYVLSWTR